MNFSPKTYNKLCTNVQHFPKQNKISAKELATKKTTAHMVVPHAILLGWECQQRGVGSAEFAYLMGIFGEVKAERS